MNGYAETMYILWIVIALLIIAGFIGTLIWLRRVRKAEKYGPVRKFPQERQRHDEFITRGTGKD